MEKTNFGTFRNKELVGTNGLLNEFMRAFDLNLIRYMSNEGKMVGPEVRDYYNINEDGQKLLISLLEDLKVFRAEYYQKKSAIEIAERIKLDISEVYPFVKNRTYSIDGYSKGPVQTSIAFENFNEHSEVSFLSSFQILRDIQIDKRFKLLKSLKISKVISTIIE
ncbi:hypothetical protein [Maribacter sp. R77961]|uniref:hypothetical protein n=1 Tax=Maribacter sp. R77961 TaxID=3093871 RepID=UPI0037CBFDB2